MIRIGSELVSIAFADGPGLSVVSIRDEVVSPGGHEFLRAPSMLFEFAVNNGPPQQSTTGLVLDPVVRDAGGAGVRLDCHAVSERLLFSVAITTPASSSAVFVQLTVTSTSPDPMFLRTVLPKIQGGLVTRGRASAQRGAVPKEIGDVAPLVPGVLLGMPLDIGVGLPTAMNSMELASVFDAGGGGGIFFADVRGDVERGDPPLQLTLTASEVAGFWVGTLPPGETIHLPGLAIAVHSRGDWHAAVDWYTRVHRASWSFKDTPAWLRDAGAIYTFAGGGAGSIYLALPGIASLASGELWVTSEGNDGPWTDGAEERTPRAITPAGFALSGADLAAAKQNDHQLDVFVVRDDGAIWCTCEGGDGPWTDGDDGRPPGFRVSPAGFARPGAPLVACKQNDHQLDVFVVRDDGAIWCTCEGDDGPWTDGDDGRLPGFRVSPTGFARPGAPLVACKQNDHQLDVFVVRDDGAIWCTCEGDDGPWTDGDDGRLPGFRVSPAGFARPGAPLVACKQNDHQLDVFVVRDDGAIWCTCEAGDGPWTDGDDGRPPGFRVSPAGFARPGAPLAACKQNDHQLDVFVVRDDGAIWCTCEAGDGPWTDGDDGRPPGFRVSPAGFARPGAPLAACEQNDHQLDVLIVRDDGAIWCTCEGDDGPWTDGDDGRLPGFRVSPTGFARPGAPLVACKQNDHQLDAFVVGTGRLTSFRELPKLLAEARTLGTDIVYLWDYWQIASEGADPAYWNKGDYIPRQDLGGEAALIDGIAAVHALGGRVILYLEPFIIYEHSHIAHALGADWQALHPDGSPFTTYARNLEMVAPLGAWQDYVVSVAERLVGKYGADGIFLDSYAWQMNRPMKAKGENRLYTPLEHGQGVLRLTERVRDAVRAIKPDAVVLGETTAGPIAHHWDGGLATHLGFDGLQRLPGPGLTASPVRYGIPEISWFTNGTNLNDLHQVFAAGHGLALCGATPGNFIGENAAHIRQLVNIRRTYADAIARGEQTYQPATGRDDVAAYRYHGSQNDLLTLVNTSDVSARTVNLTLRDSDSGTTWRDLIDDTIFSASGTMLNAVALPPASVRILIRV